MHKFSPTDLGKHVGNHEIVNSSVLADRLVKKTGISHAYARQVMERSYSEAGLWRSEKLSLPRDERLFAQRSFYGGYKFLEEVAKVLAQSRRGMARCLTTLATQEVLSDVRAQKLLAANTSEHGTNPSMAADREALAELGVTFEKSASGFQYLVSAKRSSSTVDTTELANLAAKQHRVEQLLTRILTDIHRKQNVVSWDRVDVATPTKGYVDFNDQVFSAVGYSYLDAVVRWDELRSIGCPVLYDVYPGVCEIDDVRSFLQRIERATWRGKNKQRSLGVIAARGFSPDAWLHARTHRLMTVNFRQSFGEESLRALEEADMLMPTIAADSEKLLSGGEVDNLTEILKELKTNDVVVTIRSIAFEILAALTMRDDGWEHVGLGRDVPFIDPDTKNATTRDVDVYGSKKEDLWLVECKAIGEGKEVTDSEVAKFFEETVPASLKWHHMRKEPLNECRAELWTTGKFSQNALDFFNKKLKVRKAVKPALSDTQSIRTQFPFRTRGRCEELLKAISAEK